jgi:hypothetical protein
MDDLRSWREVSQAVDGLKSSMATQFGYVKWAIGGLAAVMLVVGGALFVSINGLTGQVSKLEGRFEGVEKGISRIESRLDALMARSSERREPKSIQRSGDDDYRGVEKDSGQAKSVPTIEKAPAEQKPAPLK